MMTATRKNAKLFYVSKICDMNEMKSLFSPPVLLLTLFVFEGVVMFCFSIPLLVQHKLIFSFQFPRPLCFFAVNLKFATSSYAPRVSYQTKFAVPCRQPSKII